MLIQATNPANGHLILKKGMKRFLVYFLTLGLILSCSSNDDPGITTSLVFGQYYGFCVGNCFLPYQLNNQTLKVDENETYISTAYIFEPTTTLSEEDFVKARHLLNEIPSVLFEGPSVITYGCPDCADQGGLYLEITRSGKTTKIYLDNFDTEDQLAEVIAYKKKVVEVIHLLNATE